MAIQLIVRCLGVCLLLLTPGLRAEFAIEITQGADEPVPVAVVPFGWDEQEPPPEDMGSIVRFDLARAGLFAMTEPQDMLSRPSRERDIYWRDWRLQGISYVLIGRLIQLGDNFEVQYQLYDIHEKALLAGGKLDGGRARLRDLAHQISDIVYEKLTGVPGIFATRILYVVAEHSSATENERFRLVMADVDGARPYTLMESRDPILSADWSPDGRSVAYVSFESGRPAIFQQEIYTGRREKLTEFDGLNGSPVFSPDGRSLALVLSVVGNPEIYVLDLETRELQQITDHFGIDTEPSWTPDGTGIVFTSNRSGQPQIYKVALASGRIERLTFEGGYNARARQFSDGGLIFVHGRNNIFHIAYREPERGEMRVLTETSLDESPSLAPNGAMVVYATQAEGRGILMVASIDGRVRYRLPSTEGDAREPAWSPFLR